MVVRSSAITFAFRSAFSYHRAHSTSALRRPLLLQNVRRPIFRTFSTEQLVNKTAEESLNNSSVVIFDKDGTLICFHSMWVPWALSTAEKIEEASNLKTVDISHEVYRLLGFCPIEKKVRPGLLAEATMPEIRQKLVELLVEHGLEVVEAEKVVSASVGDCDTSSNNTLKQIANLKHLFEQLKTRNVKIAVCTADSRTGTLGALKALGLEHLIDLVVCGDDAGAEPKPSPHNALAICKALDVDPKNAFMVGDTLADMGMGRSANLGGTIAVLSGVAMADELEPHADHVVDHVGHLLPIVLNERKRSESAFNTASAKLKQNNRSLRSAYNIRSGPAISSENEFVRRLRASHKRSWPFQKMPLTPKPPSIQVRQLHTSCIRRLVPRHGSFPDLSNMNPTHIIVGAGSAGCVLANRLTEDADNRVLLIEAGPRDYWWNWKIHMPAALMYNLCTDNVNW